MQHVDDVTSRQRMFIHQRLYLRSRKGKRETEREIRREGDMIRRKARQKG